MRKLQREPQKHDGSHHPVRDVRRPSWEDADKLEAEIMTPREQLQRLLIEHRTAHDPASSAREILRMFEQYMRGECICIKCGLRQDGPKEEPTF